MSHSFDNPKSQRDILPDLVRAFALFGIAIVNVAYLAYPSGNYSLYDGLSTSLDKAAYFFVNALFLMKSYSLFAFMFGVGFAYQLASAQRRARSFEACYRRRIAGMLILGVLHVALFYQGDILIHYAFFGAILYLFRDLPSTRLHRWAIGLHCCQLILIGLVVLVVWIDRSQIANATTGELSSVVGKSEKLRMVFSSGSFFETIVQRFQDWGSFLVVGFMLQGLNILAFFLWGFSAVKSGIIHDTTNSIWRKFRRIGLPVGLIGSGLAAWIIATSSAIWNTQMMIGILLVSLFSPFSTAGYLGILVKFAENKNGAARTFLARGGTSSLTAYLMQGLLMSLIFNGYGLGLYAKLGASWCIAIGAAVALFTITFASLWRTVFAHGPVEYLLRRWTYWK